MFVAERFSDSNLDLLSNSKVLFERVVLQVTGEFDIRLNTPIPLVSLKCGVIIEKTRSVMCQPFLMARN